MLYSFLGLCCRNFLFRHFIVQLCSILGLRDSWGVTLIEDTSALHVPSKWYWLQLTRMWKWKAGTTSYMGSGFLLNSSYVDILNIILKRKCILLLSPIHFVFLTPWIKFWLDLLSLKLFSFYHLVRVVLFISPSTGWACLAWLILASDSPISRKSRYCSVKLFYKPVLK